MRNLTTNFEDSAGKIWRTLDKKGTLEKQKILNMTEIKETDFYAAIGWLARENKISREAEEYYRLDNTNLTSEIGSNAGKIWQIMDIWGEVDTTTIKRTFFCSWMACQRK